MPERIVEWKPRPRNRVFIRLSGGRFFTLPETEAQSLRAGSLLSEQDIERLARIHQYYRGREKALRMLSIRSRSRHEIRNALDEMDIEPGVRDGIVGELSELGLIDDMRFTREYVSAKVDSRKLGPHRLRYNLRKLGVSPSIVDDVLGKEFTEGTQEAMAWGIVERKLGGRKPDERMVRRIKGLLQRKGLDYDVVNRVIYDLLKRAGSSDDIEENES